MVRTTMSLEMMEILDYQIVVVKHISCQKILLKNRRGIYDGYRKIVW